MEEHALSTERGSVSAERIVFACHYPFINMPGYYFTRQHQERSYVLALKGTKNLQNYYLGIDGEGLSFRSWGTHCYWRRRPPHGRKSGGGKYVLLEQAARRYWPELPCSCSLVRSGLHADGRRTLSRRFCGQPP